MSRLATLLLCVSVLAGCVSAGYEPHVRVTTVEGRQGTGYGHGVLIDSTHVLTVLHVAADAEGSITLGDGVRLVVSRATAHRANLVRVRYVKAKIVRVIANMSYEPLVLLELEEPMWCPEYPSFRPIRPGDSGSPILGTNGDLIGFVSAMSQFGPQNLVIIGSGAPFAPIETDELVGGK